MTDVAPSPATQRSARGKKGMYRLIAGAAADSLGTGISAAATLLYFVTLIGFSATSVVAAMSAGAIIAVFSPIPVGRLADRLGLIRVYCVVLILRGTGFIAYALATNYLPFLLLTLFLTALETTTPPLQQSLVARVFSAEAKIRVMSSIMAARNVALGAGTLIAGAALTTHSRPLVALFLAVNGASFLVLAWVVWSLRRLAVGPAQRRKDNAGAAARPAIRNPAFLALTGLNGLLLLHDSVLFVLLPLWIVQRLDSSPLVVSVMLALNTGLSVAMQVVFGRIRRLTSAPGTTLGWAACALVAACLCGLLAERMTGFATIVVSGAMVTLLTLGENLHTIAAWKVSFDLAPDNRHSEYMSVFNGGYGVQRIVGPLLMTGVVLAIPTGGWLVLAAVFAAAAASFVLVTRAAQGKNVSEPGK